MTSRFAAAVRGAVGERACVVALGGGADSALLLHATLEAAPRGGVRAVFAYQALPASPMLEKASRELTSGLDVAITVVDAATSDGPNLEARARDARYEAIEADLDGTDVVLTGHTANDQAETVLMRLIRGSGAGGLAGIPAVRGQWTRPFLSFGRDELRTEAERLGLPFVDDPANTDDRFLRSRVRHKLLPELEENYAPGISSDLTRTAALLSRDDEYLALLSAAIVVSRFAGHVAMPAAAIVSAPPAVATRAIRRALRRCGDTYPGSMDDVEAVLEVARSGSTAVIGGGIHVRRELPMVVLVASEPGGCDPLMVALGEALFDWGVHTYRVRRTRFPVAQRTAGRFSVLSAGVVGGRFGVRSVSPGDRIDFGTGSAPVTEVLRDHGVSTLSRPCWPLITIDGKIAAVHGIRTAAWAIPDNGDDTIIIEREMQS